MDNKNLIIAVLIIAIVALSSAIAFVLMPHENTLKDSKIIITCDNTLQAGDNLTVKLTDLNKTPIDNEMINVFITDKDGKIVVNETLKTNSKGKVKLDLELDAGKYTVNATFAGNDNFTGNTTSKKITIEEEVTQPVETNTQPEETNTQTDESSQPSEYGSYINDEWVSMSEAEYAERYPALYHIQTLDEGRYDEYHPEMYEVDKENGRI